MSGDGFGLIMRTVNGIELGNKAPSFNLANVNEEHGNSQVSLTEAIGEKGGDCYVHLQSLPICCSIRAG